jgi:effector-binding domain-containing protein
MGIDVSVRTVASLKLAAVRRHVAIGGVGTALKPALDKVWEFLRTQPGLRTDGHNVFLYHHPARRDQAMDVDFGVEVSREFESAGEVYATETPAGMVAVHVGAYDRMKETHNVIHAWSAANNRAFAGKSWEIYSGWSDDSSKLETTIMYLLTQSTIKGALAREPSQRRLAPPRRSGY